MELYIFARFHARQGTERVVIEALNKVIAETRKEEGCLDINAFQSVRDSQVFYIHSQWKDEAAFHYHAALPHTVAFVETIESLIDHPLDVTRTVRIT